jgi:hypothetical protein
MRMAISRLLLRTSVTLLMVGLIMGMVMGIKQDFSLHTAHAHLNLVGFVLMFAAGIFYWLVPAAGEGRLAWAHATLHIAGAVVFPAGLALKYTLGEQFEPVIVIGATTVFVAMALFTTIVFRATTTARLALKAAPRHGV